MDNESLPVGTLVWYWLGERDAKPTGTAKTRSQIETLADGTKVVWLEGVSGCVALTHVWPRYWSSAVIDVPDTRMVWCHQCHTRVPISHRTWNDEKRIEWHRVDVECHGERHGMQMTAEAFSDFDPAYDLGQLGLRTALEKARWFIQKFTEKHGQKPPRLVLDTEMFDACVRELKREHASEPSRAVALRPLVDSVPLARAG